MYTVSAQAPPPSRAQQTPQGGPHAQTRTQTSARSPALQPRNAVGGWGQPGQTRCCWIKRKMLS